MANTIFGSRAVQWLYASPPFPFPNYCLLGILKGPYKIQFHGDIKVQLKTKFAVTIFNFTMKKVLFFHTNRFQWHSVFENIKFYVEFFFKTFPSMTLTWFNFANNTLGKHLMPTFLCGQNRERTLGCIVIMVALAMQAKDHSCKLDLAENLGNDPIYRQYVAPPSM